MSKLATVSWDLVVRVPVPQPGDKEYIPGTARAYVRTDDWVRRAITLEALETWIHKGLRAANRDPEGVYVTDFAYDPGKLVFLGWEGKTARMRVPIQAGVDGGNPVPFVAIAVALAIIAGTVLLDVMVEEVTGKGVFERLGDALGKGIAKATEPAVNALMWIVFGVVLLVLALGGSLAAGPVKLTKGRRR